MKHFLIGSHKAQIPNYINTQHSFVYKCVAACGPRRIDTARAAVFLRIVGILMKLLTLRINLKFSIDNHFIAAPYQLLGFEVQFQKL